MAGMVRDRPLSAKELSKELSKLSSNTLARDLPKQLADELLIKLEARSTDAKGRIVVAIQPDKATYAATGYRSCPQRSRHNRRRRVVGTEAN